MRLFFVAHWICLFSLSWLFVPLARAEEGLWHAEFYDNLWLASPYLAKETVTSLNFSWAENSPHPLLLADLFSIRWRKSIELTIETTYQLTIASDGETRIWFDNDLIWDQWQHPPISSSTEKTDLFISAKPGQHFWRVEYRHHTGEAFFRLQIEPVKADSGVKTSAEKPRVFLVKDLNLGTFSADPRWLTALKNQLFFTANDGLHGQELWRTDGTQQTTQLVRDIFTPVENLAYLPSAHPQELTAFGNWLVFSAEDNKHGRELWRSDGTPEGTQLLADLAQGQESSRPHSFVRWQGALYFLLGSDPHTVWRTDVTRNGTRSAFSAEPCGHPLQLYPTPSTLYLLSAEEDGHTLCHWNGETLTSATQQYPSLTPIANNENTLFYTTQEMDGESVLWSIAPSTSPLPLGQWSTPLTSATLHRKTLYFIAESGLWATDGASVAHQELGSFLPENWGELLLWHDQLLVFTRAQFGRKQLWRTNFSGQEQQWIAELPSATIHTARAVNDLAYFVIGDDYQLWRSDGTAEGTFLLSRVSPAYPQVIPLHQGIAFVRGDDNPYGREVWITEGLPQNTYQVRDINLQGVDGRPTRLFSHRGQLHFSASTHPLGQELWQSNGITAQTTPLKTPPRPLGLLPELVWREELLVRDAVTGYHLSNGSRLLSLPFLPNPRFSYTPPLVNQYGTLFLLHTGLLPDQSAEVSLWRSSGSEHSTEKIAILGRRADSFNLINNTLFTLIQQETGQVALWRSSGTSWTTEKVLTLEVERVQEAAEWQGQLYFSAIAGGEQQLWRSDGTAEGTEKLATFQALGQFTPTPNALYFSADEGTHGLELWYLDQTSPPTLLLDIHPQQASLSGRDWLTWAEGTLYFWADDGLHGRELWMTEGSAKTTRLVADLTEGPASSPIREMEGWFNRVFFILSSSGIGGPIWFVEPSTKAVTLVHPTLRAYDLTSADSLLFFAGNDGTKGWELWAIKP